MSYRASIAMRIMDRLRGTDALAWYGTLLESERWSRAAIEEYQQEKLRGLLVHAAGRVPFYRDALRNLGLRSGDLGGGGVPAILPVVTKADVRGDRQRFIAENAAEFRPFTRSSSGTTGQPLSYLLSRDARSAQWGSMYRQWHVGGWNPGDRIVYLGGTSIYPSLHAAQRLLYQRLNNWMALSAFSMTPENMTRWLTAIRRERVQYMHAYPSSAYLLAGHARNTGLPWTFRAIFTSAEMLHPHQREFLEETFGCPVFDFYGANDGGAFAYQCEQRRGYHIVMERAIVEILREDGSPAAPGERGRVVATDLLNKAMPFIRYDAGDEAEMTGDVCPCGRTLPLLSGISGRSNDYIATPEGDRIHGGFFSYIVRGRPWLDQFQVVQESASALTMLLKPRTHVPEAELAEIRESLRRKCRGMAVEVRIVEQIPAAPNGKYQYVVNRNIGNAQEP